jgi:hypothetical protein
VGVGITDADRQNLVQRRGVLLKFFGNCYTVYGVAFCIEEPAAFGRRLNGSAIENGGFEPPPALLIHGEPGRQLVGHQAPRRSRSYHPAQAIEDLTQAVLALRSLFGHEGQIGSHKGPFVITIDSQIKFRGTVYCSAVAV